MRVAFVMDPIERVNVDADTSFALMLAAQERGHEVYHVAPEALEARGEQAWATWQRVELRRVQGDHATIGEPERVNLGEVDAVFVRTDPPFDVEYLHAAHLLELAQRAGATVLNDPRGLMAANEKLYALRFPQVMPDTLVTRSPARIKAFMAELGGSCIIKPIDGHGGAGIFMLSEGDRNLNAIIEASTREGRDAVMCQAYVPAAREGDKRILLLDGEPLGAILRVPQEDDNRGNIHVGGTVARAELTERDLEIVAAVAPSLRADGLAFVGIDVLGDYLTEINVTSPTGIQEMSRLDGVDYPGRVIAWIEAKRG